MYGVNGAAKGGSTALKEEVYLRNDKILFPKKI